MGDWLPALLQALDDLQRGLLAVLAALHLAGEVHGQAAWPFGHRIAIEVLAIDRALARQLLLSVALAATALVLAATGSLWRRARWGAWSLAALALAVAPWPPAALLFEPAVPTSFHRSPTGFRAASIAQGAAIFAERCAQCHGADGRGEGPLAARQPMWPPDLTGALLWRRTEGELLWRVLHGLQDRRGRRTMPGFAGALDADRAWAVLDHLQAQAAGRTLQRAGVWEQPVALPDLPVRCDDGPARPLRSWAGQRLRVVAAAEGAVREDPRFVTVVLTGGSGRPVQAECRAEGADAWEAFARIAGVEPARLAGLQFLADKRGWLRARSSGSRGWSEADLVCRGDGLAVRDTRAAGGLDLLLARMDAEPVRLVRGGVPH